MPMRLIIDVLDATRHAISASAVEAITDIDHRLLDVRF
jgi:hypothetical protein